MRPALWFRTGLRDWPNYLPLVPILQHYQRRDLAPDITAGIVVGMVTIPQAVAYAFLAGVPPQSGLYACLLPMLLYAVFGSSRHLVVGPVAVAALMVTAAVSEHSPKYSDAYLGITTVICLQTGIIMLLMRLTRMGGLINLLSHPVITGFINAAAILIIISQLPAFTGIEAGSSNSVVATLTQQLLHLSDAQPSALLIGVGSLVALFALPGLIRRAARRWRPQVSSDHALTKLGPMLVAAAAVLLIWLFGFEVAVVGDVPSGLPSFSPPPFDATLWLELLPSSMIIALVAYVESYSIGANLAAREKTRVNSHQELIALGAANIGAAFSAAYPVAGSFSRSSVNYFAGARTPMSSIICALVIVAVLLFFTGLFTLLPHAVLAAIVMVSVIGLMDMSPLRRRNWKLQRDDVLTEYATMLLVLFVGVEIGLAAGVILSVAFFIRKSSQPNITQVGRLANTEHFRSIKRYDVETLPNVLALRVDENIYFANATQIEDKFLKRAQRRKNTRHLLLVCTSVNMVDATGLQMLQRLNASLSQSGVTLSLSDVKGIVMPSLEAANLPAQLTGRIFFTADRAMKEFERMARDNSDFADA
ncbi:MAG: SulP family inorganic anion transporter [Pseudomonadota bacterium]